MSVAILLVTHENFAEDLLQIAQSILDQVIDNIASLEVPMSSPLETVMDEATRKLSRINIKDGLLILTDLVGSTPFNVAMELKSQHPQAIVVSGLNLPMLLKVSNYRNSTLNDLADKAVMGGQSAISTHE